MLSRNTAWPEHCLSSCRDWNSEPSVPQIDAPQTADLRKRPETASGLPFWLITGSRRFALFRDVSRPARGLPERRTKNYSDGFRIEPVRPDRVVAGRRLVDHPTPQVTVLATLQRVRPAKRLRPREAGGDDTHDRPRHEGIRCPARIGADRLKPGRQPHRTPTGWSCGKRYRDQSDDCGQPRTRRLPASPSSVSGTRH